MSDDEDIVTILRECAADSRASEGDYYADQHATSDVVFDRAADEIERLRKRVAALLWCAEKSRQLFGNALLPRDEVSDEILRRNVQ